MIVNQRGERRHGLQALQNAADNVVHCDTEMFVQLVCWRGGAKAVHADEDAVFMKVAIPALLDARFDANPQRAW